MGLQEKELNERLKEGEGIIDTFGLLFESMERDIDMIRQDVGRMQDNWVADAENIEDLERMAGFFIEGRFRMDRKAMKTFNDIYNKVMRHINFVLWKLLDVLETGRRPEPSAGPDVTGRA